MKSFLLNALLPTLALVLLVSVAAVAQPGGGSLMPTPVPVDGGASLLLAGGIAYAAKTLRARRRKA